MQKAIEFLKILMWIKKPKKENSKVGKHSYNKI